jgi:guanylate kinase
MNSIDKKGYIFVFTGPDGSGRKTVSDMVGETLGIPKVVSYTTRKPRTGEIIGVDYHYISMEQFTQDEEDGVFLEAVQIGGVKYGIKATELHQSIEDSGYCYAVVNAEGCEKLKELYGEQVVTIFLHCDVNVIVERQKAAGSSQDLIDRHVAFYGQESAYKNQCKYSFENRDSAHTAFAISQIIEPFLNRNLLEND